jgi:hypothetical protein
MRRPSTIAVTAPDGHAWVVGPRWKARSGLRLPSTWRGWYEKRAERKRKEKLHGFRVRNVSQDDDHPGGGAGFGMTPDVVIIFVLALIVGLGLLFFVVWPLLAIAVELVVAIALLFAGLVGRLAFGHPWTVEARRDDGEVQTWRVRGYGPMRAAVHQIAEDLAAGTPPRVQPDAPTT